MTQFSNPLYQAGDVATNTAGYSIEDVTPLFRQHRQEAIAQVLDFERGVEDVKPEVQEVDEPEVEEVDEEDVVDEETQVEPEVKKANPRSKKATTDE